MKTVGLVVAVEDVIIDAFSSKSVKTILCGKYKISNIIFNDCNIYIIKCLAGEICAASATQLLISKYNVEVIINLGVVGALTDSFSVRDTALVESVVHYDFDTSESDHCEVGRYLQFPAVAIETDRTLLNLAREIFPNVSLARIASGDKFIANIDKKRQLAKDFGADICDMESAGIVITCYNNNIPCLLIKAISDSVTGGAEEYHKLIDNASEECVLVVKKLLEKV
ncbi:MAG: 5'-methylthioadenosine/S-adenosylhomocysteine nucleosidase [Clostridia bacterium]